MNAYEINGDMSVASIKGSFYDTKNSTKSDDVSETSSSLNIQWDLDPLIDKEKNQYRGEPSENDWHSEEDEEEGTEQELIPEEVLTQEQMKFCQDLYQELKDEELGGLPAGKLGRILRKIGCTPTEAELQLHRNKYDILGKGILALEDVFLSAAHQCTKSPISNEDALSAFKWFSSKYPETKSFLIELSSTVDHLTMSEAGFLENVVDPKRTGLIDINNIIRFIFPNIKEKRKKGKKNKRAKEQTQKKKKKLFTKGNKNDGTM